MQEEQQRPDKPPVKEPADPAVPVSTYVQDMKPVIKEAVKKAEDAHPGISFTAQIELTEQLEVVIVILPETSSSLILQ